MRKRTEFVDLSSPEWHVTRCKCKACRSARRRSAMQIMLELTAIVSIFCITAYAFIHS
jgi:formate dehydrogenase maturation protein FdhE